ALTSGHGAAVQVRVALALALAGLVLLPAAGREVLPAFVIGALGLFATFSVISHGAVMGGWLPLVSDLVHFAAAGAWAGAVFALVLAPLWDEGALRGLSRVGLLAVIVLAATGTLSALVHAGEPERFLASSYAS